MSPDSSRPNLAERHRNLTILRELDNASALLSNGLAALIRPGWSLTDHAATFTVLASGMERLAKLCIGLAALDQTGEWPANMKDYGHDLGHLRREVDKCLEERIVHTDNAHSVARLRDQVKSDPVLRHLFAALDAWAQASGRYGVLNSLAGQRHSAIATPEQLWEEAELAAWTPEIRAGLADPSGWALTALRESLATSLILWWQLIYRAWSAGMFGPLGRALSSQLNPTNPVTIEKFARSALAGH